jgi:hypothetical protein
LRESLAEYALVKAEARRKALAEVHEDFNPSFSVAASA